MARRLPITLLAALTFAAALSVTPAHARTQQPGTGPGPGLENCTAGVCHFDVPPGTYDVRVRLGGEAAASTGISGETRRSLLAETPTEAGEPVTRSFTVNVRTPEGEPTGPDGTAGLDLAVGGSAPALAGIRVTPAAGRHTRQIFLVGDSTVCDQPGDPYSGWGQQLPQYLRKGISVANYADSGESTVTYLADPRLFATVRPLIRKGDLVLIQLAHNDKQTDEPTYRANLETLVAGVREKGGRPVLVTPVVRRWFNSDGTLNNGTALLVNGLGVDHPAVTRSVAAAHDVPLIDLTTRTKALVESLGVEGSKALYLYDEKRDNTHTSARGATAYAGLVRDELLAQGLVPERLVR
ncbi:carbohydrate esterase [Streptomyces dioscori]|uniref:Carbohydrate esterase n=1 Tax=Streptomyces dioscori TaxID=2109333 RepID=A0A2P8Q9B8_9ACTN|nr:rhamnogalacturonan acetylesterase [Streptomyces dioscori]PSM42818.1 carbohydrate esterase [Streptomyces dioscori]